MTKHNRRAAGALLLAAWCASCGSAGAAGGPEEGPPDLAIPRMSRAPVVDGIIDPGTEWAEAALVSGVTHAGGQRPVQPRQTRFWIAWDEEHLFLAARSELREGERLATAYRITDTQMAVFDDTYELGFDTRGRSTPPGEDERCYKMTINFFNIIGAMKSLPGIGGFDYTWSPEFTAKSRITPDRRYWDFEMILPVRTGLEQMRDNRAGDPVRLLLGRNYKYPWDQVAIPPMRSGYFDSAGWVRAVLVEDKPYVRLTGLEQVPHRNRALFRLEAVNPGPKPASVTVATAWTADGAEAGDAAGTLAAEETLDVPAAGVATFALDQPLPGKEGAFTLRAVTDTGHVLLDTGMRFARDYGLQVYTSEEYRRRILQPGRFDLQVGYNPLNGKLRLKGDVLEMPWLKDADSMTWRVLGDGDRVIAQGRVDRRIADLYGSLEQLPDLSAGTYRVQGRILDAAGRELAAAAETIEKKDEQEAFPWLGNRIGDPGRVIPPYTAVAQENGRFTCWGRSYTLNGLGLPASVQSRDGELLAAPVRIVVVRNGREETLRPSGRVRVTETKDWRIAFEGRAEGAGLAVGVQGEFEQDGTLLYTLTYEPADGKPLALDALRFEVPLRPWPQQLMHCVGPGGNYASKTTGFVPEGEGRVWDTTVIGKQSSQMTVGTFYPQVWVGDDRRGLLWWGASDRGWFPDDAVPAHELVRQPGELVLRNNLIGRPVDLAERRTLRFALCATPFRPLRPRFRLLNYTANARFSSGAYKQRGRVRGWNLLHAPSRNPDEWPEIYAGYKRGADAALRERYRGGVNLYQGDFIGSGIPLMGYGTRTLDQEVLGYFKSDWQEAFNPSQNDYYLSLMDQWVREGGLRKWYFDITFIRANEALLNGMAYLLPDGRVQPGYNIHGMRRLYRRVFAMMEAHGLMPGAFTGHSTNCYPLMLFPWIEAILDGEFNHVKDDSPFEWVDGMGEARMRSMCQAQNWGIPFGMLVKLQIQDNPAEQSRQSRSVTGWLRLHDIWQGNRAGAYWRWGLHEPAVKYSGYWRTKELARANDGDLKTTIWRLPGRALLLVFNDHKTEDAEAIQLDLDLAALDLQPEAGETLHFERVDGSPVEPRFDARTGRVSGFSLDRRQWVALALSRHLAEVQPQLRKAGGWGATAPEPRPYRQWGLGEEEVRFFADGAPGSPVRSLTPGVDVHAWTRPDRVLLMVANTTDRDAAVRLDLDYVKLGLMPIKPWRRRLDLYTLERSVPLGERDGPDFDPHAGTVTVGNLPAGAWITVGVERY